jgi:hypothetical protein
LIPIGTFYACVKVSFLKDRESKKILKRSYLRARKILAICTVQNIPGMYL